MPATNTDEMVTLTCGDCGREWKEAESTLDLVNPPCPDCGNWQNFRVEEVED